MLSIILSISFLSIGIFSYIYFNKWVKRNFIKKETIINEFKSIKQKCLYEPNFKWVSEDGSNTVVDVSMECEIVEEFDDCYKIKILNYKVNDLNYSSSHCLESYRKAWDNSFVDKDDKRIKILRENKLQRRKRIIKNILEKC